jgi:hypothetical protein
VPADPEPPELARMLDFAERSRTGDWSLRSALVRYAQANPVRVSQVIELVRRLEAALHPHAKLLVAEGPVLWAALTDDAPSEEHAPVVGLLAAAAELDGLGDRLAAWAEDRSVEAPHAEVDAVVATVTQRLDELGVPREEQQRPPRGARARG